MEPRRLSWVFLLGFSGRNVVVLRHHDYRWVSRTRTRDSFQLTARDDKYILRISLGCFNFFFSFSSVFQQFFSTFNSSIEGSSLNTHPRLNTRKDIISRKRKYISSIFAIHKYHRDQTCIWIFWFIQSQFWHLLPVVSFWTKGHI